MLMQRPPGYSRTSGDALKPFYTYGSEKLVPQSGHDTCIECVKTYKVYSYDQLEPGDHVIFRNPVYDHHAILISKNEESLEIVEASNSFFRAVIGFLKIYGGKARIRLTKKNVDFAKQNIYVVEYRDRLSKSLTVEKAKKSVEEIQKNRNYRYNLFHNNCEHFATNCATSKKFSVQVTKFSLMWKMFWRGGLFGISDESTRNKRLYDNKLICKNCYLMNGNLLSVEAKTIESERDIEIGDIIRYTYWNLCHEAVVLKLKKSAKRSVVCSIAHYAFCGPFSYRTIIKEDKEIRFDGQCKKLDYAEYNVYSSEEVVKRAESRVGEQCFAFFSNDSSHFARWCKLKLLK